MNQSSSSKRKVKVYETAEERAPGRGDKVSESLAVYAPARGYKSATTRRIAGLTVPNEVWRFAVQNDLLAHLETAVRLAKECFKKIDRISFSYDVDPEIENESWINLHARIKGTFEELLQQDAAYTRVLGRALPANKQSLIRFFSSVECEE